MPESFDQIFFYDAARSSQCLERVITVTPEDAHGALRILLAQAAHPDQVVLYLDRLAESRPEAYRRLVTPRPGLSCLVAVLSQSRFLAEGLLKNPSWLEELLSSGDLYRSATMEFFAEKLETALPGDEENFLDALALAQFRRQQLLRIVLRDVLHLCTLPEVTAELSELAGAILDVCYRRLRAKLLHRFGKPLFLDQEGRTRECGLSVLALGKLGGMELNYSSDIDLMFIYSGDGYTEGPESVTNKEFFIKLATNYTDLLSQHTPEGFCYRVDLRLRPEGTLGEVCVPVRGAKAYYENRARDWELQMLIKARVAAGEPEPGRQLLHAIEPMIYSTTTDFSAVEAVSEARIRFSEKLAERRGKTGFDVKLARGGIRDIEFLVQCLQRLHGGRVPWVRHGGTLLALFRLRDRTLLSPREYARLANAYTFLRNLEHRLQFDEDRQRHTLPSDDRELDLLARRMPYSDQAQPHNAASLLRTLNYYLEDVQEIYERVIHAQQPMYYTSASLTAPPEVQAEMQSITSSTELPSSLIRFLDQRAPRLAEFLAGHPFQHGQSQFEHFLDRIINKPEWLGWLEESEKLAEYLVDVVEHSPYLAEELVRTPELLREIKRVSEGLQEDELVAEDAKSIHTSDELRWYFRRAILRIQAASVCRGKKIFNTLARSSQLADFAIQTAYRMAVEDTCKHHPPRDGNYQPASQLSVIALGRLGMREFDLGSDADLVFALPDQDAPELLFWTKVTERLITLLSAYTGEGRIFTVDTRLRPNGREGALVATESTFMDYFQHHAEAWEGITYMKSRAVAGDIEHGTAFLKELQEIDFRRYGQSGRSRKQLAEMRVKLEREQGEANPLKAGKGGYYDIDFALLYLRLKGAGIFYHVLNTPARIEVVEKMGHLDREDAAFLLDAATFYRAVDHASRVSLGRAEGRLPQAQAPLLMLAELTRRWTPAHLHDQPLDVELRQIQAKTREFFNRLFI